MDFKNKGKLKKKDKENNKSLSKDKYTNYNSNHLTLNNNKNKSLTSIINNNKNIKKDYLHRDKGVNDYNINNNKIQNNNYSYLSMELIDKENDTYEQLKQKNKKLREIIIKFSKQLEVLSIKYENIKNFAEIEKRNLLEKLDKISSNYKLYAESYKENAQLKKEKDILAENSSQINLFFNSCKNSLINLLKKNMQYYTKLKIFYENKNDQYKSINFNEFIFSLKEELLNNLIQYKNQLDIINFPTFFYEYNTFIYEEINHYGLKRNNNKEKGLIRNDGNTQFKENNSFDEFRKYKKKLKEKENDKEKSPKVNKKNIKRNVFLRDKTPSKSNCNLSYYQNFKNFHKTHFHNSFNEKNSNNKNKNYSNISTNKSNISKETEGIFGDVGNIIQNKKRYSLRKKL